MHEIVKKVRNGLLIILYYFLSNFPQVLTIYSIIEYTIA